MAVISQFNNTNQGSIGMGANDPTKKKEQSASGQFTNLSRVIGANQGAGAQLAGKLEDKQTITSNQAQSAFDTAKTGTTKIDDEKTNVESSAQAMRDAFKPQAPVNGAPAQPGYQSLMQDGKIKDQYMNTAYGMNQGQTIADQFNKDYSTSQARLNALQQMNQGLSSAEGRAGMIRNLVSRPGYGSGLSALDNSLLQAEGTQSLGALQNKAVSDYAKKLAGQNQLGKDFKTGYDTLNTTSSTISQDMIGKEGKGGLFRDVLGQMSTENQAQMEQVNQRYKEDYDSAVAALTSLGMPKEQAAKQVQQKMGPNPAGTAVPASLTDDQISRLGLDTSSPVYNIIKNAYAADPKFSQYLQKVTDASLTDVIDANEFGQFGALNQLLKGGGALTDKEGKTYIPLAASTKDLEHGWSAIMNGDKTRLGSDISEADKSFRDLTKDKNFSAESRYKEGQGIGTGTASLTGKDLLDQLIGGGSPTPVTGKNTTMGQEQADALFNAARSISPGTSPMEENDIISRMHRDDYIAGEEAAARAGRTVDSNVKKYLEEMGYFNTLGNKGMK